MTADVVQCFKNAAQNSLPFASTVTVRDDDWLQNLAFWSALPKDIENSW